jgi:hypothetical protein
MTIENGVYNALVTSTTGKGKAIPLRTWTGVETARISRQSAHDGGKLVNPISRF